MCPSSRQRETRSVRKITSSEGSHFPADVSCCESIHCFPNLSKAGEKKKPSPVTGLRGHQTGGYQAQVKGLGSWGIAAEDTSCLPVPISSTLKLVSLAIPLWTQAALTSLPPVSLAPRAHGHSFTRPVPPVLAGSQRYTRRAQGSTHLHTSQNLPHLPQVQVFSPLHCSLLKFYGNGFLLIFL